MPITAKLGGKITDSHATMTETSAEIVGAAVKLDQVTKISLGEIRHVPGGRRGLKFLPINGGVKAVVRGNGAIHHVYLYTAEPQEVIDNLLRNFRKSP